jgi:hypothetical protein
MVSVVDRLLMDFKPRPADGPYDETQHRLSPFENIQNWRIGRGSASGPTQGRRGSAPAYLAGPGARQEVRRRDCSVTQLLAAKGTRPIRSLDELADTFESDKELEEFLAFTHAERHRDLA